MRKYLILTTILALCACANNGGGHSGSDVRYNVGNGTGIIGDGGMTKPGDQPGDTNPDTPEPPVDDKPDVPEHPKKGPQIVMTRDNVQAIINKDTNEIYAMYNMNSSDYSVANITFCKSPSGCNQTYKYRDMYLYIDEQGRFSAKQCLTGAGCEVEIAHNEPMLINDAYSNGTYPHNVALFSLNDFANGEATFERKVDSNRKYTQTHHIILGSQKTDIPLKYTEFGYWDETVKYDTTNYSDYTTQNTFIAGDPSKVIDMKQLYNNGKLEGNLTYSGTALVRMEDKLMHGDAHLTFNANNSGKETLNMDFTKTGWYDVFVDGKSLSFRGSPETDAKYMIANAPVTASTIDIKYYGDETDAEAVGKVIVEAVHMQDGSTKNMDFTFGAVKD